MQKSRPFIDKAPRFITLCRSVHQQPALLLYFCASKLVIIVGLRSASQASHSKHIISVSQVILELVQSIQKG